MTGRNGEYQGFCCMNIRCLKFLQPSGNHKRYVSDILRVVKTKRPKKSLTASLNYSTSCGTAYYRLLKLHNKHSY